MTKYAIPCAVLCLAATASVFGAAFEAAGIRKIEVWDQRVAIVNTEAISKRDVEERMGEIAFRLLVAKKELVAKGTFDTNAETQWTALYVENFREALRKIVRERLMIWSARDSQTLARAAKPRIALASDSVSERASASRTRPASAATSIACSAARPRAPCSLVWKWVSSSA